MPKTYTVRGVPASIAMDAWWLTSDPAPRAESRPIPEKAALFDSVIRLGAGFGGLFLLILLGDFLFWGYRPGFTLALFAIAIFGVAVARHKERSRFVKPGVVMGLSVLPVIEHVQFLSLSILLAGGLCALGWLTVINQGRFTWVVAAALKLLRCLPVSGLKSLFASLRHLRNHDTFRDAGRGIKTATLWRNWAFPAGGALVLGALLISANPVLEQLLARFFRFDLDVFSLVERGMFWTGLGLLIWPLINAPQPQRPVAALAPFRGRLMGLNSGSVLRALLVFNAFLAVQSVLDFSILLAGADLPDGMSYATYAHRGAYPLLATAMLAGAFTFAAHPFLNEHRWIKPLLLIWVAQNVLLTLSAVLRLDLYITEYGLTYLRIYALIWMGLLALGLVMTLWHVMRERPSTLLMVRLSILGFGTLYLCAFVNFASIIATHTMARVADPETSHTVDWWYLCQLGPTAHRAIAQSIEAFPEIPTTPQLHSCNPQYPSRVNWREWDFRTLRTHGYLSGWSNENGAQS